MKQVLKILSDLKNRIRLQQKNCRFTNMNKKIIPFLKHMYMEGLIQSFVYHKETNRLEVFLRTKEGHSAINTIKVFPSGKRALYVPYKALWSYSKGTGCLILTTNQGILSHKSCLRKRIGGKALAYIS